MKKIIIILLLLQIILGVAVFYYRFGFGSKIELVNNFYNQVTDVFIEDNNNISVYQTVNVSGFIPISKDNNSIQQYCFSSPICSNTDTRDSIKSDLISNITNNIELFDSNHYANSSESNDFFFSVKKDEIPSLTEDLKKKNYKVTFSYIIDSTNILSYSENNEYIIMNLKGNKNFSNNNDLIIHTHNDVKVLNNDTYINKQDDNTYKIDLKNETIQYIIQLDGINSEYVGSNLNNY